MVAWHHRLNGLESEQTPGDSEGQGSLVCCSPRGPIASQGGKWQSGVVAKYIDFGVRLPLFKSQPYYSQIV